MLSVLAIPDERDAAQAGPAPARADILSRYRHLRAISKHHSDSILGFVSSSAMLQQARRLGISDGRRLMLNSMSEFDVLADLLVYAAPAGRSRAIDRYARNQRPPAGSDGALMLDAMRAARFAVLIAGRRHSAAGIMFTDLFRNDEDIWLVDEGIETWIEEGMAYATRYHTPERFSITAGIGIPVHRRFLKDAIEQGAPQLTRKPTSQAIDDPRFAEAVYRAAIREGIMGA
jgi:hypothetical protein